MVRSDIPNLSPGNPSQGQGNRYIGDNQLCLGGWTDFDLSTTWLLFYNNGIHKKLKLSNLHFRHNIPVTMSSFTPSSKCCNRNHSLTCFNLWATHSVNESVVFEWIIWANDSSLLITTVTCIVTEWISILNESVDWTIQWLTQKMERTHFSICLMKKQMLKNDPVPDIRFLML